MRLLLLLAFVAVIGSGCSGHYAYAMADVHELARKGQHAEAYQALRQRTEGTGWDPLLVALDEGALLHRAGQWEQSAKALSRALAIAEERETVSISEELLGRAPFRMSRYEKQALHALQAINYLQLGQIDGALVEARRTDLRQRKLDREAERSANEERFITGSTLQASTRDFFDQLLAGRFISAVAWEAAGQSESAFIDYHRAWSLARAAPADAKVPNQSLAPNLLRLAREVERPEAETLRQSLGMEPEPPLGNDGQLIVIVEAGYGPALNLNPETRTNTFAPVPRSTAPGYVVVSGVPSVPEPLSSFEELATRRGYRGVLVDRERSASVGINTVLAVTYVVLFPVAMPLLIKRGYESAVRMDQSWLTLPRELQAVRLRLPAGTHEVWLPSPSGLQARTVEIRPGRPTVVVAQGP